MAKKVDYEDEQCNVDFVLEEVKRMNIHNFLYYLLFLFFCEKTMIDDLFFHILVLFYMRDVKMTDGCGYRRCQSNNSNCYQPHILKNIRFKSCNDTKPKKIISK